MVDICQKDKCTGCNACLNACPKEAIVMKEDIYGFIYPFIDPLKCIDCGLCEKTCPMNNDVAVSKPSNVYAAYSNNQVDRDTSSSGGAASIFSKKIIEDGGIVYGCSQASIDDICHVRISSLESLCQLKGSKYVQSSIGKTYLNVKNDLLDGRSVLFVGTPCQVAGLKAYLKKEYEKLLLVDLCCHGVPSKQLMIDNVNYIRRKKKLNFDISDLKVVFRKKTIDTDYSCTNRLSGKRNKSINYGFYLGSKNQSGFKEIYGGPNNSDYYITGFLRGVFFRDSCYQCKFASSQRCSDITIADFWGLKESPNKEMDENRGVSAILINTDKGYSFFESVKARFVYEERPIQEAIKGNPQLMHPFIRTIEHDVFFSNYKQYGWEIACQRSFGRQMKVERLRSVLKESELITYIYRLLRYGKSLVSIK